MDALDDFGDEGFMELLEEPSMSGIPQQWQGTVQATQGYPPGHRAGHRARAIGPPR